MKKNFFSSALSLLTHILVFIKALMTIWRGAFYSQGNQVQAATIMLLVLMSNAASAQTLAAGDIAIVGVNTDGPSATTDEIAIVALATIPSGTTIYFSDYYWDNTNSRWGNDGLNGTTANLTEGIIKWTTTSAIAAGTVFRISWTMGSGTPSVSGLPGTVVLFGQTGTTAFGPLGQNGDNFFIYQSNNNGVTPSNWIFGWCNGISTTVSANNAWQSSNSPILGIYSMLPTGLTNGTNAVSFAQVGSGTAFNPSFDNNVYNIGSLRSGTKAAVLSAICTTSNWAGDENTAYDISPTSTYFTGANAFFIGACTTPTAYTVTGGGSFCSGGTGVAVGLANSETGVTYQLKKDGINDGTAQNGTAGSAINFGLKTAAGTYTVVATRTTGGCTANMTGSAVITVNSTVTPNVSISASPSNTITAGTSVTFTAVPTHGGSTPSYQWKKNGNNVGTNQTTYTDATLANGDVITCVMTSNAACASSATVTSNTITMVVTSLNLSLVTPPAFYCAGSTVNVNYASTGLTFNTGNTFTLQLSDASGSFATPTVLATLTATATSGTISGMIPWAQAAGTGYRVRVVSSNTAFTGANNGANLEVKVSTATATISATSGGIVANPTATGGVNKLIVGCQGTNVVLTANVSNQSSFEWRNSNVLVAGSTNAPTLTVNSNWGDYQLVAIDGNGCGAAADTVGINLQPIPIATVGPNRDICPGTTVKIGGTAQANTTYTWTPATHLSSASAANPDVLATLPATTTYNLQTTKSYTVLSANFTCTSVSTPVSVTLKSQPAPPTISLVSPNNLICQGTGSLTLSASNVVGTLRWYRGANLGPSGTNPLTESSTGGVPVAYTARNTDVNGCVSVASNSITLAIRNAPTPTISTSIGTLQSGSSTQFNVCTGITSAVFTANISASASTATPVYSWFSPVTTPATLTGTGNTNAISGITTTNQRRFVRATYVYPSLTCTATSLTMDIRQSALATGCRLMQNGQEEEVALENTFSAYPNPTSDKLTAQIQVLAAGEAALTLVNQLGQIVWQEQRNLEVGTTEVELSLAQLPAGIYHFVLNKEDMYQTMKVMKE